MAAVIKSNPGAMSNVLHAAMQQMALLEGKAELVKVTLTQDMVERKTVDVPVSLAKSRTTDMNNMNAKDMNSLPWWVMLQSISSVALLRSLGGLLQ